MARTSSKPAPTKGLDAREAALPGSCEFGATLLTVLLIPRLARLFYPAIWVEDDFYLEAAWLVSAGLKPYLDFVHPHFPMLEYLTAGYLKIFGASHFSIEILNQAAIYLTSLLTFKLAARAATRRTAICAAILYATSSLVFRYHVYERECFVAPLVLVATILALDAEGYRRAIWIALALTAACLIKLTAAIPAAVVVAFLAVVRRHWREAIMAALAVASGMLLATAICYWLYGSEFLFQTFIFHFMKGRSDFFSVMTYPLAILDLQVPLFVLGCIALRYRGLNSSGMILVLAMVAAEYLFFGILSPTAWGHNYLEALPFITIIGAVAVDWMIGLIEVVSHGAEGERSGAAIKLAGGAFFIVVSISWISPLENENWIQGSAYGFGFVPREEVSRVGAALRSASAPLDEVLAPAFICFQANRRELIRFPETYGVWREAELEYQRNGFSAARGHLGSENFFRLIAQTAHFWRDPIIDSIRDGRLNAVIPDSPVQLLPLVLAPAFPQVLVDNGFRPILQTEHFILWKRASSRDSSQPPPK